MKLLFIYNANSGKISTALDIAHKLISPKTYQCNLCALTHSTFKERDEWTVFKQSGLAEMAFFHKDEFEKTYGLKYQYPAILQLAADDASLEVFMNNEEINAQADSAALIQVISAKIQAQTD